MAKSYLNQPGLPRGLRNNNPGNLRDVGINWRGRIGADAAGFTQFENIGYGLRALALDLGNDIGEGKNSIRLLIGEFAPPSENDTAAYIRTMSNATGFGADQRLSADAGTLQRLIRGILTVELGGNYAAMITDPEINEGLQMAGFTVSQPVLIGSSIVAAALLGYAVYLFVTMDRVPSRN